MQSLSHQFLTFCRSKPRDEEYNYLSINECAFCQFLRATGFPVKHVGPEEWTDTSGLKHQFDPAIEQALGNFKCGEPNNGRTFGALADRLSERLGA